MDAATLTRLRVYALLYRLEDEVGILLTAAPANNERAIEVAYRHIGRAHRGIMLALDAYALTHLTVKEIDRLADELRPAMSNVGNYHIKPEDLVPMMPKEAYYPKHPERGFTGYCSNRNKYGPRKPKRK